MRNRKNVLVGRPDNLSIGDDQDEFFDAQSDPQMEEVIEDMRKQVEESCLEVGLEPSFDNERNGQLVTNDIFFCNWKQVMLHPMAYLYLCNRASLINHLS